MPVSTPMWTGRSPRLAGCVPASRCDLADDCLAHDDVGRAIKACEAGLRAMRTHAGCTEALMRAHAQSGNLDAVQRVYQAHVTALELIHLDHAAASNSDLYKQLVGSW